jgi:hypothetical protein
MLDLRGDDVGLAGVVSNGSMNGGVVTLCAATGEQDFSWRLGPHKISHTFTGFFDLGLQLGTEAVGTGGIAPFFCQVRQHGLPDFRQNRRSGIMIEINHAVEWRSCP